MSKPGKFVDQASKILSGCPVVIELAPGITVGMKETNNGVAVYYVWDTGNKKYVYRKFMKNTILQSPDIITKTVKSFVKIDEKILNNIITYLNNRDTGGLLDYITRETTNFMLKNVKDLSDPMDLMNKLKKIYDENADSSISFTFIISFLAYPLSLLDYYISSDPLMKMAKYLSISLAFAFGALPDDLMEPVADFHDMMSRILTSFATGRKLMVPAITSNRLTMNDLKTMFPNLRIAKNRDGYMVYTTVQSDGQPVRLPLLQITEREEDGMILRFAVPLLGVLEGVSLG